MNRQAPRLGIAFIALVMLLTSACSGMSSGAGEGKTLRIAATFLPVTLDPAKGIDSVFSFAETLTRVDDAGEVEPVLLAEDPEQESPRTWRLTLRDGITFQNGKAADADAVAASLNRAVTEGLAGRTSLPGARFAADGELEVVATTKTPAPLLPYTLADIGFAIHDVEVAQGAGDDPQRWVGEGGFTAPYEVVRFDAREMTLEAYEDYWQGPPALAEIELTHVPEVQARVAAVQSGQVDIADGANVPDVVTAIEGNPSAELVLSEAPLSSVRVFLNTRTGPLADLDVRRALTLGLDYEALATDFTGGVGEPATSLLPPDHPMAVAAQRTDPAEAAQLLDDAGWTMGDGGYRAKDGERLTVTLLGYAERPEFKPLGIGIQSQLEELGVEVKIVSQPFDYKMYDDPSTWDLALYSEYAISPTGAPDAYLKTYLATDGSANLWGVGDPTLDGLLDQMVASGTDGQRRNLLAEIQQRTFDQAYVAVLAFERDGALVSTRWSDYRPGAGYQYATFDWKTAPAS
ncbi:ABC transporter substrate-binding protein (plasmid) [Nocardioides sp. R1-1]|uniref:ABC transporter substrate-binding protein n=1 Tax=Nocardioides sp. R1-1 TaxID=3383502 RepID=UPI0038D1C025